MISRAAPTTIVIVVGDLFPRFLHPLTIIPFIHCIDLIDPGWKLRLSLHTTRLDVTFVVRLPDLLICDLRLHTYAVFDLR